MKAYIKRIKEVEPLINACTDERYDDALSEAREVDRFLNATDKTEEAIAKETPLLGVPFTCKESVGVKGNKYHLRFHNLHSQFIQILFTIILFFFFCYLD